jgi:hypothetical protein
VPCKEILKGEEVVILKWVIDNGDMKESDAKGEIGPDLGKGKETNVLAVHTTIRR